MFALAKTKITLSSYFNSWLLNEANAGVMKQLKEILCGKYAMLALDGWKDESKDSVNGVNISVGGKVIPSQLVLVISHHLHL